MQPSLSQVYQQLTRPKIHRAYRQGINTTTTKGSSALTYRMSSTNCSALAHVFVVVVVFASCFVNDGKFKLSLIQKQLIESKGL